MSSISNSSILALESSTERLCLAVQHGGQVFEWTGAGGQQASGILIAQIHVLMQQAGIGFAQLDAVAFGAGPGAFTGLRAACAVAQGIALGINKPLLGINTLQAIAHAHFQQTGESKIAALLDARMNEWYWQCFDMRKTLPLIGEPQVSPRALIELPPDFVWVDSAYPTARSVIDLAGQVLVTADAATLAGLSDLRHPAQPIYVRNKVAQTTAERMANKLAKT